jgi:hypothetical protein
MPLNVQIFLNKFPSAEDSFWGEVANKLNAKGYEVHKESIDCDVALMMNAAFLNPSAFDKKIGFYLDMPEHYHSNAIYWMTHIMAPILKKYYDEGNLVNLFGMTTEQACDKIINYHKAMSDDHTNN